MGNYLNEPRKRFHQPAAAIALPADVAQVQAVARLANEHGVRADPAGRQYRAGGRAGAAARRRGDRQPRHGSTRCATVDIAAGHMTLEAGVILENAHKAAEAAGAMFPLWLASQGSARIGGRAVLQCRRRQGAGLRQCARTVHGRRGGAGRWAALSGPQFAQEGQYRLRSQGSAGRGRRHAGHHHRGDAEDFPAAGGV